MAPIRSGFLRRTNTLAALLAAAVRNSEKLRRGASRQTSLVTSAATALREIRRHGYEFALLLLAVTTAAAAAQPTLSDAACRLEWVQSSDGWRLGAATMRSESGDLRVGAPSGEYTFLYSAEAPSKTSIAVPWSGPGGAFPEPVYRYLTRKWKDGTSPVSLNVAGEARSFFPATVERIADGKWTFGHTDDTAKVQAVWSLDPEAALRTRDRVTFPRGFMTPKVGPHASYGFAPGRIHGEPAALRLTPGLVHVAQPSVDYLTAQATDARRLFVVLLNERPEPQTAAVSLDAARLSENRRVRWTKVALIDAEGKTAMLHENDAGWSVPLLGFGAAVLRLDFEDN